MYLLKDSEGEKLLRNSVDSIVNIGKVSQTFWIQFAADQATNETPYTYYVQDQRNLKLGKVEYLGKDDGTLYWRQAINTLQ